MGERVEKASQVRVESMPSQAVRVVPAVGRVLQHPKVKALEQTFPHSAVLEAVRELLDQWRGRIMDGRIQPKGLTQEAVTADVVKRLLSVLEQKNRPNLRRVINATGVVLHTNLGRAVLPEQAAMAIMEVARGYTNLEYDLQEGTRGSRQSHVAALLAKLVGAEAALVVNNNAAAVLLTISAIAAGRDVIVSRGQQVEIGGSFRIPDIIRQSGAFMVEVGTTNKTRITDYANAITEQTGALLQIHTSNFRVVGFTQSVPLKDLVELGRRHSVPVISDLGSGSLIDLRGLGVTDEPTVQECIAAGADVVTFSGDKLLGGPQAGIIVGRKRWVDMIAKHPLARAVRSDKLTLAALEAVLRLYRENKLEEIPTLSALYTSVEELQARAEQLQQELSSAVGNLVELKVVEDPSQAGGGSLPGFELPGRAVAVKPVKGTAHGLQRRLREVHPAVIGRQQQDRLLLNVRTLLPGDIEAVVDAFVQALSADAGSVGHCLPDHQDRPL